MVGVGVIGLGFGRMVHVPGFLAVQNASVIGIASRNSEQAREVATKFSLPQFFSSWKELIECPDIEAVSVATPPSHHEEIVLAALAAGKAVLCEKPLALNSSQAKRMFEAARMAGLVHMMDFEFREIPAWQLAKRIIESGELGPIRHVSVRWIVNSWANQSRPWSWRADRSQGGGALGGWVVHSFDYLEWLLKPIRTLTAHLTTQVLQRPDLSGLSRSVSSEDVCHVLLELEGGVPVSIVVSPVATLGQGHWVECFGERKVLKIGSSNLQDYGKDFQVLIGEPGDEQLRQIPLPSELSLRNQFADGRIALFLRLAERFIAAVVRNDTTVRPSFEDGYRAQVLIDLAHKASDERCWVQIPGMDTLEK